MKACGGARTVESSRYYEICQVSDLPGCKPALIAKSCHLKLLLGGINDALTEQRSRFWIVRGRQVVKMLFHCA